MAEARDKRIDQALEALAESLLANCDDEQYYSSLQTAQQTIDTGNQPSVVQDEAHVKDLIRQRLIRSNDRPDHAVKFSNLYDRLLSQPVLDRKWAHLYLLHLLSPQNESNRNSTNRHSEARSSRLADLRHESKRSHSPATARASAARSYDDPFARNGIPAVSAAEEPRERPSRPPVTQRRRDKAPAMTNGETDHSQNDKRTAWLRDLEPSEASLLRDLPFMLQGISTASFTFTSNTTVKLPQTLPGPIIALLHTLVEPGLLYKGLATFQESSDGGLVAQSLRAAIGIESRAYLALVASLEGQIRRALAASEEHDSSKRPNRNLVTLKRCVVWTRDATMGLRLMSLLVEEGRTRKGGQLISLIHSFASTHGDPFVSAFAERLLSHVTRPFYAMLRLWIYDGELSDPYLEFFVQENNSPIESQAHYGATNVWEDKYKLEETMVPTIMTLEFANKIFLIGKSLNFIRHGCADSAWVETHSRDSSKELVYGDTATLEISIDEAHKTTMIRLLHLMNNKFHLQEHLLALKQYLLLGSGDFVALLMESLSTNLDRPANTQFRHTLTAQLEHAVRNSNAQYDSSDVLNRLDARMLNHSHGDIGWDVFTLEYKIDNPIDVVVTPASSREYLKVFNFLWRVKRVEYALSSTWRRCMTGSRGILRDVEATFGKDWKVARCALAEMVHFVAQLQYYILFEVIEASWDSLQQSLKRSDATLDDVVAAHKSYLRSITRKGLLGKGHMEFTSQLHELLKVMLLYREAVDGLYSLSNTESAKKRERAARIETRTAMGKWGVSEKDDDDLALNTPGASMSNRRSTRDGETPTPLPPLLGADGSMTRGGNDTDILTALRTRLRSLSTDFRTRVSSFLGDLAYQPDTDLRFLGVTMNWNEVYKVQRRTRRTGKEGGANLGSSSAVKR